MPLRAKIKMLIKFMPEKFVNANAIGHKRAMPNKLMIRLMLKVFELLECFLTSITESAEVAADSRAKIIPIMPTKLGNLK